jgi:hypothetical protein
MIDRLELAKKAGSKLSTRQRSSLLKICRSRLYYKHHPRDVSDDADLMNEIHDIYQKRPYFGYLRMTDKLNDGLAEEDKINKKRHIMGYSVSSTLDTSSVLDALEMAVPSGHKPKMINSDQGCQFTAREWVYSLALLDAQISMDGKGRWADNISIERFWRTLKYEEVYLKSYDSVRDAKENLAEYINWYNNERRHSGIGKKRSIDVLMGQQGDGYADNSGEFPTSPHPQTGLSILGRLSLSLRRLYKRARSTTLGLF